MSDDVQHVAIADVEDDILETYAPRLLKKSSSLWATIVTPSTFAGASIGTVLDETTKLFGFDEGTETTLPPGPPRPPGRRGGDRDGRPNPEHAGPRTAWDAPSLELFNIRR